MDGVRAVTVQLPQKIQTITVQLPNRIQSTQVQIILGGGGGGGETNTASNVNSRGVGVFVAKSGVDLQFTGIDSSDPLLNVDFDSPTQTILLSTNIFSGTGDPPNNLPNGSLYFKIS